MAHTLQERYSSLVDAKLRDQLVKKDGVIFNNRYEGDPKAGAVKVPVRDTEVTVGDYNKQNGAAKTFGATTYLTVNIDKDKAINEVIDGYDAAAVPDNLVADRLDSGAYALAAQIEADATTELETNGTAFGGTAALTKSNVYASIVSARTALSKAKVPNDGRRWILVSPEVFGLILTSDEFTHASDLGDVVLQTGALGKIGGFLVFEDNTLSATTDYIAGHPDWCTRVREWSVPVHVQDLNGSGDYIGASAVQGRTIYAHKITKPATVLIKTHTA